MEYSVEEIKIILGFIIYAASRYFSGHEDGLFSLTEIALAQTPRTSMQRSDDKRRRDTWHKKGAIKLVLATMATGIFVFGIRLEALFLMVALLNLQVLIFNPVLATRYLKQSFFYLSPSGFEGLFKRWEKMYYFLNLALLCAFLTLIII